MFRFRDMLPTLLNHKRSVTISHFRRSTFANIRKKHLELKRLQNRERIGIVF